MGRGGGMIGFEVPDGIPYGYRTPERELTDQVPLSLVELENKERDLHEQWQATRRALEAVRALRAVKGDDEPHPSRHD